MKLALSKPGMYPLRNLAAAGAVVLFAAILAIAAHSHAQNTPAAPAAPAAPSKPTAPPAAPATPATPAAPPAAAAPAAPEYGLISDFDSGEITSKFGSGWSISEDSIMGGQSTAEMKVVDGEKNTKGALQVTGKVSDVFQTPWAGVMFSPGPAPFAAVDLSSKKVIAFSAKGDGRQYAVLVFTEATGFQPAVQTFSAGPEWKEYRFPFSAFGGTDGHDVTAIIFSGGLPKGDISFTIDTVRLE